MQFTETHLPGVYVIDLDRHEDDRAGSRVRGAARLLPRRDFPVDLASAISPYPPRHFAGHAFSSVPHAEAKMVRCVSGAVHDVALDLRPSRRPTSNPSRRNSVQPTAARSLCLKASRMGFKPWPMTARSLSNEHRVRGRGGDRRALE